MSIPPRLSRKLKETLGPDAAGDLVNWLDEMRADREAMRADFAELRQEMRAMEARLGDRIHAVELKIEKRSADLIRWSFVFWVSAVAAIAALAGVLRNWVSAQPHTSEVQILRFAQDDSVMHGSGLY